MVSETDSLALVSNQPKNAKSAIIQKLSKQWPLTPKQLTHAVQREYGMDITYQAVHKALLELEKEKVLSKEDSQWKLNPEWLKQHHTFVEKAIQHYQGKKNHYSIDLNKTEPQYFEFDSFTDFCVETANLIGNKILCKNGEIAIVIMEYGYWSFKFKFEHLQVLLQLMLSAPKSVNFIRKITPFGKWIQEQYRRVGAVTKENGAKIDIDEDLILQGNWIIEIQFSPKSKKIIEHYWNKWKSLEDGYREFGLKEEPKMEIRVKITKNIELANFMRKQFDKYLQEGK
ncbi:MAG: hypothetical protein IPJ89_05120 [Candidatus Iainarchaeum archaeon]|uniref:Uncharacterized protein n=1 Tax=Candidatus Iainarchaeum sp. TaxID=3101447 RepID=A0A7T9I1M5_9ARCH|nr:MAG: hypothetical protein IPJ89_05120 [Candidatus Diapherotrites archaeon]